MTWVLTGISLCGNVLNCMQKRSGFILWIACNLGWMAFDIKTGVWARVALDAVQTALCVYGFYNWGKTP